MSDVLTARIVNVEFSLNSGKCYAYYTNDPSIVAGDLVVVVTPWTPGDAPAQCGVSRWAAEVAGDVAPVFGPDVASALPGSPPVIIGGAKIVRVVSTVETVNGVENVREWIVTKLDFSAFIAARARKEQIKVLRAKIHRARNEALESLQLDELAAKSPALKGLLDELAQMETKL